MNMRRAVKWAFVFGLVSAATWTGSSPTKGESITFIYTGSGTGTIGNTSFTNATFTITAVGDTSTRQSSGSVFSIDDTSASIDILGVGTFNFITGTRTFVANDGKGEVGFSRASLLGADLYDMDNRAFKTWDELTSIGPISGNFGLLGWSLSPVLTTGGTLVFLNESPIQGTFQAIVPEPPGVVLFGSAIIALAATLFYRNRLIARVHLIVPFAGIGPSTAAVGHAPGPLP